MAAILTCSQLVLPYFENVPFLLMSVNGKQLRFFIPPFADAAQHQVVLKLGSHINWVEGIILSPIG